MRYSESRNATSPVTSAHEIMPVLPSAAVLAGRLFGDRLVALRLEPVLGAGLAVMVAALAYTDVQPTPAPQNTTLPTWLEAHHLMSGPGSPFPRGHGKGSGRADLRNPDGGRPFGPGIQ
jgi:hypothetical protein